MIPRLILRRPQFVENERQPHACLTEIRIDNAPWWSIASLEDREWGEDAFSAGEYRTSFRPETRQVKTQPDKGKFK
jgi:hypothetical protein